MANRKKHTKNIHPKAKASKKISKKPKSKYPKNIPNKISPKAKKERDYSKTKTYKNLAKKYKRRSDKKYWKEIQKEFKALYDKKGQPLKIVMISIDKKFISNTRHRLRETKIKYTGKEKWRKGKDGKWKEGKTATRYKYRDRLTGTYLKGKKVGRRFLQVMQKDLIRKYMKKKRIKNYNKAKKKFWEEAENKSIRSIIKLYGDSP